MGKTAQQYGNFTSFGEYLQTVKNHPGFKGQGADPRLVANGPGLTSSESAGADGGFAAPPGFLPDIIDAIAGPASILGRCAFLPSERMQVTLPANVTAPWDTSNGVQVTWATEAQQLTGSRPSLEGRVLKAHKLIALVSVTEEVLEEAPALGAHIEMEAPKRLDYAIGNAILNGDGVGRPLGLLNAGSKITVPKTGGQAAATFTAANASAMVGRLHAPSMERATWIMNPDVFQQVTTFAWPTFAPAGVSGYPLPTLLGIPILQHEACKALGTEGDVVLADLGAYLTIRRARTDFSAHVYFDFDVSAFRFIIRFGGLPLWEDVVTPPNSTVTRSMVVTLAARS